MGRDTVDDLPSRKADRPGRHQTQEDSEPEEFPCGQSCRLEEIPYEIGFIAIEGINVSETRNLNECGVEHLISQCEGNWQDGARFYDSASAAVQDYILRNKEIWPAVTEYKVAIIVIATPLDGMLHLVRQGIVQRTAPGTKKQGWTWTVLHALAERHHRIQIYDDTRIAMDDARRMDAKAFVINARRMMHAATPRGYAIWRCKACHMLHSARIQEHQAQHRHHGGTAKPWRTCGSKGERLGHADRHK